MRRVCLFLLAGGLVVLSAAPADAADKSTPLGCVKRTDVAVLDEYCAALPGADGRGADRGPALKRILPPKARKRLEKAGPLGQVVLALSAAAPRQMLGDKSRGRGLDADELVARGRLGHNRRPPGNPITASARAVTSGGVGSAFGSVVLLSTFGVAGAGWLRFRRRPLL